MGRPRGGASRRAGAGAHAVVELYHQPDLDRVVAVKSLAKERARDAAAAQRIRREGRMLARLEHPGILPLYAAGQHADGRPWLSMRAVEGCRTLSDLLADPQRPLRRHIELLYRLAEVVGAAHERGVVHRDLSPANVLIEGHAGVLLADWELAADIGEQVAPGDTPEFMAPEHQAWCVAQPTMDVYALGQLLALALRHHADAPSTLTGLCEQATAIDSGRRPSHAYELSEKIREWLDGRAARRRARQRTAWAQERLQQVDALRQRAREHTEAARIASERERRWEEEDRAKELREEAEALEATAVEALRTAISRAKLPAARLALATVYRARAEGLSRQGDRAGARRCEQVVRTHAPQAHASWLNGRGTLVLSSDPPGARVQARRFVEVKRRLRPGPPRILGNTPVDATLEHGSWQLELQAPGHEPVRLLLVVPRGGRVPRRAPGEEKDRAVWLPPAGSLGRGEIYIPAGWARIGGDRLAPDTLPARRIWVDDLVIERHPVTVARYLAFLRERRRQGVDIEAWLPRAPSGAPVIRLGAATDVPVALHDHTRAAWQDRWPITGIDHASACALARWERQRTGLAWRLPHSLEWEKAARGVDGRAYPWGDHFEPDWARMRASRPHPPERVPVDDVPEDIGPHGLRGAAGNVREWCLNGYRRDGPAESVPDLREPGPDDSYRMVKGGSFTSDAAACRLAARFVGFPSDHEPVFGMRLCRSIHPMSPTSRLAAPRQL